MKSTAATTPAAPHEAAGHQTLSAYIQARFDEFSRSQKDVAQYIVDHLDEVAFQTAEELARRANTSSARRSCASRRRSASRASPSCSARRARSTAAAWPPGRPADAATASPEPLFSLDQNEFETALAADHVNVEETARKCRARTSSRRSTRSSTPSAC